MARYLSLLVNLGFKFESRAVVDEAPDSWPSKVTEIYVNTDTGIRLKGVSKRVLSTPEYWTQWIIEDVGTGSQLGANLDFESVMKCLKKSMDMEVSGEYVQ